MSDVAISTVGSDAAPSKSTPGSMVLQRNTYNPTTGVYVDSRGQGFSTINPPKSASLSLTPNNPVETKVITPTTPIRSSSRSSSSSSSQPQSTMTNITASATSNVSQPLSESPITAEGLVAKNLPLLDARSILQQKIDYAKATSYTSRVINPMETITSEVGNRMLFNPAASAQRSVAESEGRILERINTMNIPEGQKATPKQLGEVFGGTAILFVGGVGRGVLTNPVDVLSGTARMISNPSQSFTEIGEGVRYNPAGFAGEFVGQSILFEGAGKVLEATPKFMPEFSPRFTSVNIREGMVESITPRVLTPVERRSMFLPDMFPKEAKNFEPIKNVVTPISTESGLPFISESGSIELQSRPTITTQVIGSATSNPNVILDTTQFTLTGERLIQPKAGKLPLQEVEVTPFERNPITIEQIGKRPLLEVNSAAQSHWFPNDLVSKSISRPDILTDNIMIQNVGIDLTKQSSLIDFGFEKPLSNEIVNKVRESKPLILGSSTEEVIKPDIDNSAFFNFEPQESITVSKEISSDYALGRGKRLEVSKDYSLVNEEYIKTDSLTNLDNVRINPKSSNRLGLLNTVSPITNTRKDNIIKSTYLISTSSMNTILPISKSKSNIKQTHIIKEDIISDQILKQDKKLVLKQKQDVGMSNLSMSDSKYGYDLSSKRITSRISKPREPKPEESKSNFYIPSYVKSRKKKSISSFKSSKFKASYTPSVEAAFFNIRGSKPSARVVSQGLATRPILLRGRR